MIKTSFFVVICMVINFEWYTHAQDVSSPVCKWNNSTNTCEKDPSKMIKLLTSTNKMFALLMRCQYATTKSTCNSLSKNTCIWKDNACRISSKKLIDQISDCFQKKYYQNEINKCKNELQNISKNITWINKNSVRPASSCEDTIRQFQYTKKTCRLIEYSFECSQSNYSLYGCRYYSTDMPAYQLVNDLHYIMGVSQSNTSILQSFLEYNLDIKYGNLYLYDRCSDIQSSYKCECRNSLYQYCYQSYYTPSPSYQYTSPQYQNINSPSYSYNSDRQDKQNNVNKATIIVSSLLAIFLCVFCCAIVGRKIAQNAQNVVTEEEKEDFEMAPTVEILQGLPNVEFKVQEGHEHSESICCICLDKFEEGDSCTVLECAHCFHKNCLDEWIRTKGRKVACPLCNNTLQNIQQSQQ